jgi:hypothetical protein
MLSPKAYISGKIPNLVAFPVSYQRYLWKSLGTSAEKKKRTRERKPTTLEQILPYLSEQNNFFEHWLPNLAARNACTEPTIP